MVDVSSLLVLSTVTKLDVTPSISIRHILSLVISPTLLAPQANREPKDIYPSDRHISDQISTRCCSTLIGV